MCVCVANAFVCVRARVCDDNDYEQRKLGTIIFKLYFFAAFNFVVPLYSPYNLFYPVIGALRNFIQLVTKQFT